MSEQVTDGHAEAGPNDSPARAGLAVRAHGVVREFGPRRVIDHLDIEVAAGEIVALLGASGCGKTTLLRVLAGLDRDAQGDIDVVSARAVVYQEHRLLPWRRLWQNVAIGLPRSGRRAAAEAALAEVGQGGRGMDWPHVLSGGESARVALARALVREPEVMLLDEPFAALDALTRLRMHALLMRLWERHHPAIVMVTHDVDEAAVLADRILVMNGGRIAQDIPVPIAHPRRRSDPAMEQLHGRLLRYLGVEDAI
jgi:sulfonate transport system ATP-binding protein